MPNLLVESLRSARVAKADLLLWLRSHGGDMVLVARDADTGEFVAVAPTVADATVRPLALSHDGTNILLGFEAFAGIGLVCHTVATGTNQPVPRPDDGGDQAAAFSPDPTVLATLGSHREAIFVDSVDVTTGRRRRLWSGSGIASVDQTLTWSPDGQFLAATYLTHDDTFHTVVVDLQGTAVADFDETEIVGQASRSWAGDHDLLLARAEEDADPALAIVDVLTGEQRRIAGRLPGACRGAVDGRLVVDIDREGLSTTDLHGAGPRAWLAFTPPHELAFFDAAADARICLS